MEKRLILAIVLSLLVLISWSTSISRIYHLDNKGVTEEDAVSKAMTSESSSPQILNTPPSPGITTLPTTAGDPLVTLACEKFDIIFSEPQAAIKEVIFKDYNNYNYPLQLGFWLEDANLVFRKDSITQNSATFVYNDENKQIIKRFIFDNSSYVLGLEINVHNLSSTPLNFNPSLLLGVLSFNKDQTQARYQDVSISLPEKTLHLNGRKNSAFEKVKFLSLRDRYFCTLIQPASDSFSGFIKTINHKESQIGLNLAGVVVPPGQQTHLQFRIYLGPQELKIISQINPDWSAVMYYGTFNFISHLLLQLLEILFRLIHNWGWVIVILSVGIYFLLYPLSLKQMAAMKQMQVLQPHIEELRKTYKDNPQKLNKEIMDLYREHKVNPLGGCLPMVLQIPVFFALYQVLVRSVALKGASFLWIKDLSEPDKLFTLPVSLPVIGNEVNILPIIMAIGMFMQQKISLSTASGSSAEQQKIMMIVFPIMFGFIFYKMPSGLVLYWFINSGLMLWQQFKIHRKK